MVVHNIEVALAILSPSGVLVREHTDDLPCHDLTVGDDVDEAASMIFRQYAGFAPKNWLIVRQVRFLGDVEGQHTLLYAVEVPEAFPSRSGGRWASEGLSEEVMGLVKIAFSGDFA